MNFDGSLLVSGVRTRRPGRWRWFLAGAVAAVAFAVALGAGVRP